MLPIQFTAHYGKKTKQVKITQPSGAGDTYFIFIDNYYCGPLFWRKDHWVHYPIGPEITGDDVQILGDMINAENP